MIVDGVALVGVVIVDGGGCLFCFAVQKVVFQLMQAFPKIAREHVEARGNFAHGFEALQKIVIEAANTPHAHFNAVGVDLNFCPRHACQTLIHAGAGVGVPVQCAFDGITQAAQRFGGAFDRMACFFVCLRQCRVVKCCREHVKKALKNSQVRPCACPKLIT